MICILALIVFGILGIFSVKYRIIAKEAFDCVFRRITFRKCTSGLDIRLKAQITGNLMKKAPNIATKVYKNFKISPSFKSLASFISNKNLASSPLILNLNGSIFLKIFTTLLSGFNQTK